MEKKEKEKRGMIGIYLPESMIVWLKQKNEEDFIPMSRVIEKAVKMLPEWKEKEKK